MVNQRSATLVEVVVDALEQEFRDGSHLCGDRLVEMTLAQAFNVSQNTIREALRILEQNGWVVKVPRHGVQVRSFTIDEASELYMLQDALEGLVLDWMIPRLREKDKMHLASIITGARIQAGMNNGQGVREAIINFHSQLVVLGGKTQTANILRRIHNQIRLLGNLRAIHDPENQDDYADRLTHYGKFMTHIRYNEWMAARSCLHDIIMEERRALLTVLDLI